MLVSWVPDHAAVALLVRWIHVLSATLLLGGALLVYALMYRSRRDDAMPVRLVLPVAARYEALTWGALGLLVLTGLGNLGAFGPALPDAATPWGRRLAFKLVLVAGLLALNLLRSLVVARLRAAHVATDHARGVLSALYLSTVLVGGGVLGLALALAHG